MKRLFILTLLTLSLHASSLDLGLGGGAMFYPDYLGSKHNNSLFIPYPYISYKSDKLTIDREGLQQKLLHYGRFSVELSAGGSLPLKSSGVRKGMKNLDPAMELGPALLYNAYEDDTLSLKIDMPIRAVVSSDFKTLDYRGYIYELRGELEYQFDDYELQFHTGFVWADSKYHNYLYGVKRDEVNDHRTFYEAQSGYTGYKTSIGLSKRFEHLWAGAFVRYYSLYDSVIKESPLKEKDSALYGGVFIAYIFDDAVTRSIKNWLE